MLVTVESFTGGLRVRQFEGRLRVRLFHNLDDENILAHFFYKYDIKALGIKNN